MQSWQPFGNTVVVSAGADLLVQSLCHAFHAEDAAIVQSTIDLSAVLTTMERVRPAAGGRKRWWRWQRGEHVSYICVDLRGPGFRTVPPDEADIVIEDAPAAAIDGVRMADMAAQALALRADFGPARDPDAERFRESLAQMLATGQAGGRAGFAARMQELARDAQQGRMAAPEALQRAQREMYQAGLAEFGMHNREFSAAYALFELQARSDGWIEQAAYERPLDYMRWYIKEGHAPREVLDAAGKEHFNIARDMVRGALSMGCLWEFQERMYLALHHYCIAHLIARLSPGKLSYSRLVAEESWVCTFTGIVSAGRVFYSDGIVDFAAGVAERLRDDPDAGVDRFMQKFSSEYFPIIPQPVARMFVAHAELATGRTRGEQALHNIAAASDALEAGHLIGATYNAFMRDSLLLDGARRLGLDEQVAHYAAALAGRLVVDRSI